MRALLYPVAIIAGGLATRLRPMTERIPKSLIEVAGEPFIAHQLRLLRTQGVRRVVVCAGYLGEMICEAIGKGEKFGLEIAYSWDGEQLLGTAGALRKALALLGERFFTLYGDSYLTCNFGTVQRTFERSGATALMTVFRNDGRWDKSNVEFAEGRILAYDKQCQTPRMRHIDYGLGVFRSQAFESIPVGKSLDLAAIYREMLGKGQLAACEVEQRFYEIGSLAGIEELQTLLGGQDIKQS